MWNSPRLHALFAFNCLLYRRFQFKKQALTPHGAYQAPKSALHKGARMTLHFFTVYTPVHALLCLIYLRSVSINSKIINKCKLFVRSRARLYVRNLKSNQMFIVISRAREHDVIYTERAYSRLLRVHTANKIDLFVLIFFLCCHIIIVWPSDGV